MAFRIAARTILQLGAELISSDAIAFYELIKNAFDAESETININVVVRIPHSKYLQIKDLLLEKIQNSQDKKNVSINEIKESITSALDTSSPNISWLTNNINKAQSLENLLKLLDRANYISFKDKGTGMSLNDLEDIYLTIGTRSRFKKRERQRDHHIKKSTIEDSIRPILGEKGIGRLSAMRLGERIRIKTSKKGESKWNNLEINWRDFSHYSDKLLEDIRIEPTCGDKKNDYDQSGTQIRIYGLLSSWSKDKLVSIAQEEFSKLTDPFLPSKRYPVGVTFNKKAISIPRLDEVLFKHAHAEVEAQFNVSKTSDPKLSGRINYRRRLREKTFQVSDIDLLSVAKLDTYSALRSLGPFKVKFYWYNRQAIKAIQEIGTIRNVRDLIKRWAGGLMVFRDGFRVNPYGNPDDDWLDLDRKALATGGYKVNRNQIIGKVEISSNHNLNLTDQTNREGLRDCDEKQVLIKLLNHILRTEFKTFMDKVDKEIRAREPISFNDLEERVESHEKQIKKSLQTLTTKYPKIKKDSSVISGITAAIKKIHEIMGEAKELAESYKEGKAQMVHLAGLGLMVEILAHELNRATSHTLLTLSKAEKNDFETDISSLFKTLSAQLTTLQKRLSVLDPLSTSGRQRKEIFDIVEWLKENIKSHDGQFQRHKIECSINLTENSTKTTFRIKAVKGMVVQVFENLISNSVFWIKQQKKLDQTFTPKIDIKINPNTKELQFTDNGPGVDPARSEEIFQPFVTTKPPGEGKGLGLFISREIAEYHDAEIYLLNKPTIHPNKFNTFVLKF